MMQTRPFPWRLLLIFGLATAAVLPGGVWFYSSQEQSLQRRVEAELQGVAHLKVDEIATWRAERLGDANVLMDDSSLVDAIARWMAAPQPKDTERILSRFRSLQENYHYEDVELLDAGGQIRLSLTHESGPVHEGTAPTLAEVFRDRQPALTDLHFSPGDKSPHIDVFVPLFAQNGGAPKPAGAILLEVDARQFLFPLLESWPTPSGTAETLLIRRDGNDALFLNDLRYKKGAALTLRIPLSKVETPAVQAVLGKRGIFEGKDYRGVKVLAALSVVPDSPWFMVSKMDGNEAFSAWQSQSLVMLTLVVVFLGAMGALTGMVWQRNQKTHYESLVLAQGSVRESEEKYRHLFENAQVGMYRSKLDGTALLDVNDKLAEILGFSRQELLGASTRIRWARQEDWDGMLEQLKEHGGSLTDFEAQVTAKNGDVKDVVISIELLPDEGCLEGTMHDITARKLAEEELRRVKDVVNSSPVVAFRWKNTEGWPIEYVSDNCERVLRCSRDALFSGQVSYASLIHPDDLERVVGEVTAYSQDSNRTSFRHKPYKLIKPDGQVLWVDDLTTILRDAEGRITHYQGIVLDITERKCADDALALNAVRLELLLKLDKLMDAPQPQLLDFVLAASLEATQSRLALVGLMDDAEAVMIIHAFSEDALAECAIDEKPRHFPVAEAGIWAECVRRRAPFMLNQYDGSPPGRKGAPAGHVPIKRLLAVPVFDGDRIVAVAAVANKADAYTESDSLALAVLVEKAWGLIRRKQVEEALRDSEERFRRLFNGGNDAIFVFGMSEDSAPAPFIEVNDVACARLGYSRAELLSMLPSEINAPESAASLQAPLKQLAEDKNAVVAATHLAKDGRRFPVEISAQVFELDGRPTVLAIARDVSERKQAEEALQRSAGRFLQLLQSTDEGMYGIDLDGNCTFINRSAAAMLGYPPEDCVGRNIHHLIHHRHANGSPYPVEECPIYHTLSNGSRCRVEDEVYWRRDGTALAVEYSANPIVENGQVQGTVAAFRDITERKQRESELRKLSRAMEQSPATVVITDREGNIEYANPKFTQTTGYTVEEALGQNPRVLKSGVQTKELYEDLWGTILAGREWYGEFCNKKKNGELYWEFASISPVLNEAGEITHFVAVKEDITARKLLDDQLKQAKEEAEKANHAKSEFLSRMSHELRTPLNAILGFAQLMEMGELDSKHAKGVKHIRAAGGHLLQMINEVLDIARIESGHLVLSLEPVQLRSLIPEVMDLVRPMADVRRLTLELADAPANDLFVRADRQRFKQVLVNVVNNAIKYNHEGGRVVLDCRLQNADVESAAAIRISISDTGPGIAAKDLERLFEPFERIAAERTETEGTGLGLAIAERLMEAMGGTIGVESVVGQGSTFWLELPLVEDPLESAQHLSALEGIVADPTKTGTVLYVEDNLSNLQLMEQILTLRPAIELITAMRGEPVLDLARGRRPDLILLDLNLPDMHGADVLRLLRGEPRTQAIPVVVISADATSGQIDRLKEAGAQGYLAKPLDVQQLLQVVDKIVGD